MFAPEAPTVSFPPLEIAPETFLIQQVQPACGQPLFVYINSLVIRGQEPVIVDTGTPANRTQWLEEVFTLVAPEDVRWIYLSHDDVDHTGNLDQVMEACPNATLVCTWAMVERHTNCFNFPLDRCRWLNEGEAFDAGDRQLVARRPPRVGLTHHAWAVGREHRRVLGSRQLRDAARRECRSRRSRRWTPSSGSSA